MKTTILTLLLSQKELPTDWQESLFERIARPDQLHLFCLAQATHLLHADFSALPPGRRIFCAHSHRLLGALHPPADTLFEASGLVLLGAMVRDSHGTFSLPHSHWSGKRGELGMKNIGILLGNEPDTQKESIRLATGLAGCNHRVTLYTPLDPVILRMLSPESAALLDALEELKATFKIVGPDSPPADHAVLLQL